MNNSFTCLVKSKPVKQEVNRGDVLWPLSADADPILAFKIN